MSTATTEKTDLNDVLGACVRALRRHADYELEPALARRMLDLGERKEWLNSEEHEELLELVAFAQDRSNDKIEAQIVLDRIRAIAPEVMAAP